MFAGERINASEGRSVLHAALRRSVGPFPSAQFDVMPEVIATRRRGRVCRTFARRATLRPQRHADSECGQYRHRLFVPLCHKQKNGRKFFDIREQQLTTKERDFENALRPLNFEDFSGQDKVVDNLRKIHSRFLRGEKAQAF